MVTPLLAMFIPSCSSSRRTQPVYFTYSGAQSSQTASVPSPVSTPSVSETTQTAPSDDHLPPIAEPQEPRLTMTAEQTKQAICQEVSALSKMCAEARDNGNRKEDALYGYTQVLKSVKAENGRPFTSVDAMAMRLAVENAYSHPEKTPDEVESWSLKTCLSSHAK